MPDLRSKENIALLDSWDGSSWAYLAIVSWVKLSSDGTVKPSSFPPNGDN